MPCRTARAHAAGAVARAPAAPRARAASRPALPARRATTQPTSTAITATPRPTAPGTHLHPLDTGAESTYGPRGVLLVGLPPRVADAAETWLHAMEPGLPVAHCTGAMLDAETAALLTDDGATFIARPRDDAPPPEALPRTVLLSGMLPAEAVAIAEHWTQFVRVDGASAKQAPTFCVLTPTMLTRKLGDVVLEATLAAAAARDNEAGGKQRGEIDADGIRAALREKMAARAATRASGPISLDVGGATTKQPGPPPPSAAPAPRAAVPARAKPKGFGQK